MDPRAGFDGLVASVTFSGSLISFLATTAVLCCYVYYRNEQRSFRHALVFNLALAGTYTLSQRVDRALAPTSVNIHSHRHLSEFINTANNSVSGIIYLRSHALYDSPACTANGFIGQLSVQAADFSILVIALVTLLTITRTTYLPDASPFRKTLICLSVWIVPIITSCVALALGSFGPVSGNWCWIMSSRTDLRYALTHGWRIAIIFCTAGIYLFVWWYMNRHFRSLVSTVTWSGESGHGGSAGSWYDKKKKRYRRMSGDQQRAVEETEMSTVSKSRISRVVMDDGWELSAPEAAYARADGAQSGEDEDVIEQERDGPRSGRSGWMSDDKGTDDEYDSSSDQIRSIPNGRTVGFGAMPLDENPDRLTGAEWRKSKQFDATATSGSTVSEFPTRRQTRQTEREIKRMLLLNAYPIMYVILWIPGLVNRFMEASGNKSDSRVLAALQASSQFVGLANALTYGFNTALRRKVKVWWRGKTKKGRRESSRRESSRRERRNSRK